jgi:2,4-dienoyl-CoA reductase-like NADH-dependent reductase (Old Yellow Enzyme family)
MRGAGGRPAADPVKQADLPCRVSPRMSPALFSPLTIGPMTVANRLVVAPMCQYSADDGSMTDWHLQHLMTLGLSGAGLIVVEATAVERHGRITHGCTGLYSDANERAMVRVIDAARAVSPKTTKFAIQIGHAGRKASAARPWDGGRALAAGSGEEPWPTFAPSPLPFDDGWPIPGELTDNEIGRIIGRFVEAVTRAVRVGFDAIELHMAHGYLLHSFQSPLSNHRTDRWGGSPQGRRALPLAVAEAVRAAVPAHVALGARITGQDWHPDGLQVEDAVALAGDLKARGLDYICVSSGGATMKLRIEAGPGYQVPFARRVKEATGLVTRAVGMIATPAQAEEVIASGAADQVALARAMLDNPRWPWHAAEALGAPIDRPVQYARVAPGVWPGTKLARPA